MRTTRVSLLLLAAVGVFSCQGPAGPEGKSGSSCTTTDNGNGTVTISCTDGTSVTVSNGTSGRDGQDGQDGTDGRSGDAGTSCSIVTQGDGGRLLTCTDGTVAPIPSGGVTCTVKTNFDGSKTVTCSDGTSVNVPAATEGFRIDQFHGTSYLEDQAYKTSGKYRAKLTITSAAASPTGQVTVAFSVRDPANQPVRNVAGISATIVKLLPREADAGESFSRWVAYIYRKQTVSGSDGGTWPNPDGTSAWQAYRESNGTLVNNGDGTYVYTFATNLANVVVDGQAIAYERNRTHRVAVMMGGSSGPTDDATLDFVPDGSPVTVTRNLVDTTNCLTCHGKDEFHGHGGDRVSVEVCVTCHLPGNKDPHGGESLDMKVMIHKIHAGGELASIPGADGKVWDDPATPANEQADNGRYAIWGYNNGKAEWWKAAFPAVLDNCTKCHNDKANPGALAQVDNWKTVPSREACGSCHDTVNFDTGAGHAGGPMVDDLICGICHRATGPIVPPGLQYPIPGVHDFSTAVPQRIQEFDLDIALDTPPRGYYLAGEAPKVTVVIKKNGVPLADHRIFEDLNGAEGCPDNLPRSLDGGDNCPPGDGLFAIPNMFVHGPRARRNPVLSTAARAAVVAPTSGPWDLSAPGLSLSFVVDNGEDVKSELDPVAGAIKRGAFTVAVPATGVFAQRDAGTQAELISWLNANPNFKARALAYADQRTGRLAVRSRNLGRLFAIQVQDGGMNQVVFNDSSVKSLVGSFPAINLTQRWNLDGGAPAVSNDPKVAWFTDRIEYQLDPVDDLAPGTYVVTLELGDRGRVSNTNFRTPSVAKKTFQVKQLAEEPAPARSCGTCHVSPQTNTGLVFDFMRHYKILDDTAVDQCGACHDYQNNSVTAAWGGARAIAKRVHAVHAGSELTYPLLTVGYANGDPVAGRNWDIEFPQDLRNCQTCHPDTLSSGTWKTKPARLPCSGCHDSDQATAHMTLMTLDPTPTLPFSGDEVESCKTCH